MRLCGALYLALGEVYGLGEDFALCNGEDEGECVVLRVGDDALMVAESEFDDLGGAVDGGDGGAVWFG